MKRFFYLLPAIALVFAACSDSDDDDNGGGNGNGNGNGGGLGTDYTLTLKASEITNAPKDGEIDAVKLVNYPGSKVLASTSWDNGFSLKFPETVSDNLMSISYFFDIDEDDMDELEISDKTAKICEADIEGYKGDTQLKDFELVWNNNTDEEIIVGYVYADKDLTIKGKITEENTEDGVEETATYNYDVVLKAGWNQIATKDKNVSEVEFSREITTTIPEKVSWVYDYYDLF